MRYAISTWNYQEPAKNIFELVTDFAEMGFTAMSFIQGQILDLSFSEASDLRDLLKANDIIATIHGGCDLTSEQIRAIAEKMRDTVHTFTVDPLMRTESRGTLYDASTMAYVMNEVSQELTDVHFAIEDFPLDDLALSFYENDLTPLLKNPNYGILIDVGHLNLRVNNKNSSFKNMSPLGYLYQIPLPIIEVHIHDNMGNKDSHGHLGFGNISFPAVAKALKMVGFNGISTIEICPAFHNSTPAESRLHVKQSLDIWRSIWEDDLNDPSCVKA